MTIKKAMKKIRKLTSQLIAEKNSIRMDKIERKIFILRDFIENEISFKMNIKEL